MLHLEVKTRSLLVVTLSCCVAYAADRDRIKLDSGPLASIPSERRIALETYAITDRDGSPEIGEKKAKYIAFLKGVLSDLHKKYFWHREFPSGVDEAIEKRAIYLAGLQYPASPSTGASYYGFLIQDYTIGMYEEAIVNAAYGLSRRFGDKDIAVTSGTFQSFSDWKKEWEFSGKVKGGPDQRLEPTLVR